MQFSLQHFLHEIIDFSTGHVRVLGPPGSGKTSLLLERCHQLSREKDGNPLRVVLVTYTFENAENLVDAILPGESSRLGRIPVYRYFELAKEVLTSVSAAPFRLGPMEELLHLDRTMRRVGGKLRSDYRAVYRSDKFQQSILEWIHVLLQNGIEAGDINKIEKLAGPDARLADALTIYSDFLDGLRSPGFEYITDYDICWRAAKALEKFPERNPFRETERILIDDFQDIDAGQFALLRAVAPPEGGTSICVFGDPTGAHFGYRGTQHHILMETFPEVYACQTVVLPSPHVVEKSRGKVVRALLEETVGDNIDRYVPKGAGSADGEDKTVKTSQPVSVRFLAVRDAFEEVHTVAGFIKTILEEKRFDPHEIAVVAREKHAYEPLLSAAFHRHGIPLKTGRARTGVLENFLFDLLKLLHQTDNETIAESLQNSPFYPFFEKVCADLPGLPPMDGSEKTAAPRMYAGAITGKILDGPAKNWIRSFFQKIFLPALRDFGGNGIDPSIYVWSSKLLKAWEQYIEAIGRLGGKRGSALIGDFLGKCGLFSEKFSPLAPSPGHVGFYSCHEIKGRRFPVVYLIGCSEMIFPAIKKSEGFIPYAALQRVIEAALPEKKIFIHATRSIETHLKTEFSLLLLALTRASETLFITAPEQFGGREETGPTCIIRDNLPDEVAVEREKNTHAGPFAAPPIFDLAARLFQADGDILKKHGAAFEKALDGWSPVPLLWRAPSPESVPVQMRKAPISPSSLKAFNICPRRYFYARVIGLREEDTVSMRFGSLFHEVLRRLALQFPSELDLHSPAAVNRSREIIQAVLEEREDLQAGALVEKSIRYYLERLVQAFLEVDGYRTDGYRIETVEKPIRFSFGGWEFTGRIDRLDVSRNGWPVVVDYKTGRMDKMGKTLCKRVVDSVSEPDKRDWQIPVYTRASLASGKQPPLVFVYYSLRPGEDPTAVSLFIKKEDEEIDPLVVFDGIPQKRFGSLQLDEVDRSMDDAVQIAENIHSPRIFFERTKEKGRCRFCFYSDICTRGNGWS